MFSCSVPALGCLIAERSRDGFQAERAQMGCEQPASVEEGGLEVYSAGFEPRRP